MNTYTIADLKVRLARIHSEVEKIKSRLTELAEQEQNLAGTIAYLESEEPIEVTTPSADVVDFSGARNLEERIRIIADFDPSGIVRVTDAVDLILRSGVSKASRRSLSSSMYKTLNASNDWEWLNPGIFRLVQPPVQGALPDQYP